MIEDFVADMHEEILESILSCKKHGTGIAKDDSSGDVTYDIDIGPERIVLDWCTRIAERERFVLISEGVGRRTFPEGAKEEDCGFTMIVDPVDGSRTLMYGMDSAFVLTGIAPKVKDARLSDIVFALQTELPPKDRGVYRTFRYDGVPHYSEWDIMAGNTNVAEEIRPSDSKGLANGFVSFVKFFREKTSISSIEDKILSRILGPVKRGKADVFDHQYISTAGQLAYLMLGRYRLVADLRPLLNSGLCAHPYDLCTMKIAQAYGVQMTDLEGKELDAPLDTQTEVGFIAYANTDIRKLAEPIILEEIKAFREGA